MSTPDDDWDSSDYMPADESPDCEDCGEPLDEAALQAYDERVEYYGHADAICSNCR